MTPLFGQFIARLFDIAPDDPYIHVIRFYFWSIIAIVVLLVCLFVMEVWVHSLKFGWIKEIYTLLQIIKVREQRTIDTHEKVDKTLQRMEDTVKPIVDTVKPLIESNPNIAIVTPSVTLEVKKDDTKTSDNR